ncbi:MAG: amidohydrolase family protein [Candidatus Omnitrophica bacterium]|nr:amidohydrolase family protein [Candidatus Omnitrophota bacterium]
MFIDIHVHVMRSFGPPRNSKDISFSTPELLIKQYDKLGIEKAVLLPVVNPECSFALQGNEEILEICAQYPDRFIPFCNIDPRAMTNSVDAPLGDLLGYYRKKGCKGIGEVCPNLPFLHPLVQNLFKHVENAGLPLTFHIAADIAGGLYGLQDDPGLPQLEWCLRKFPKLLFLAHSQTFWAEMAPLETPGDRYVYPYYPVKEEGAVPKLFRRYQNLLGDLSAGSGCNALARDPEYAVKFLNEFQDRLFFGTDICTPDGGTPLVDFLLKLKNEKKITEQVFGKVARGNAIKLLALSER